MKKTDLINRIAENTGISKVDIIVVFEKMFKEIRDSLSQGQVVSIRGFGTFAPKKRAAKIARDIKKNVAIEIPEQFIPSFRPSQEFLDDVKKLTSVEENPVDYDDEMEEE